MRDVFSRKKFTEILVDELLIESYDYTNQKPMFFSKYFTEQYPSEYNLTINEALAATIQRPNPNVDFD